MLSERLPPRSHKAPVPGRCCCLPENCGFSSSARLGEQSHEGPGFGGPAASDLHPQDHQSCSPVLTRELWVCALLAPPGSSKGSSIVLSGAWPRLAVAVDRELCAVAKREPVCYYFDPPAVVRAQSSEVEIAHEQIRADSRARFLADTSPRRISTPAREQAVQ